MLNKVKYSGCLLIRNDSYFVLQKRDIKEGISNPGMITVFGGGVKQSENSRVALVRELKEELELNISIDSPIFLGYFERYDTVKKYIVGCKFYYLNISNMLYKCHEGRVVELPISDGVVFDNIVGPICSEIILRYKLIKRLKL